MRAQMAGHDPMRTGPPGLGAQNAHCPAHCGVWLGAAQRLMQLGPLVLRSRPATLALSKAFRCVG